MFGDIIFLIKVLDLIKKISHKLYTAFNKLMNFYSCYDQQGQIIARCQTIEDIEALADLKKKMDEKEDS